jgi:1-aminocyclopropane-1-carboxylate deaminase/D-cysteine desulfhydrase-like pyridoxal-dependent ACC family enzyme
MTDSLGMVFPQLAARLPKSSIADLPTPLKQYSLSKERNAAPILVKHDDLTSKLYGGNKIRKLEYILQRAKDRNAERVATFGSVASNHALATALYATALDLKCTCLLSHQSKTAKAPVALNMHLRNRTEIIRFGGARASRINTMRKHLQNRRIWVIPMGGSSWLGVIGFVNAGLEVAAQIEAAGVDVPDRLYVANGTMGTAAGLALGLALANIPTEIHAVRVTHEYIANPLAMQRLISKTAMMMHRLDPSIPADIATRTKLCFRDEFFADGYAQSNPATDRAIDIGREEFGLTLDTTYSGKAMAALLHDLSRDESAEQKMMFWNTYNSQVLPVTAERPADTSHLPEEFLRYYV